LLVKDNLILDCKGAAIQATCKLDTETGNYTAAVIEGNVCNGNSSPQVELAGSANKLIIRNNVD